MQSNSAHTNNPKGKNQYKDCPPVDDPRIPELLVTYHRRGVTDRKRLSKMLLEDHGIKMSEATIARRKRELGLKASGRTTAEMADSVKRQLVLDQMEKDPSGKIGAQTVKTRIFQDTGMDITREWIRNEMRALAPHAVEARRPRHKTRPNSNHCASGHRLPPHQTVYTVDPEVYPAVTSAPTPQDIYDLDDEPSDPPYDHGSQGISRSQPISRSHPIPQLAPLPPYPTSPNGISQPSTSSILDTINTTTSMMLGLTQLLDRIDPKELANTEGLPSTTTAYADMIKGMEAAAMLERQLSRLASEVRREGH